MNWSTRIDRRWTATSRSACALPMCLRTGCVCVGDVCQGSSWTFISRKFLPFRWCILSAKLQNEIKKNEKEQAASEIWSFQFCRSVASTGHTLVCLCCNRSDMLLYDIIIFFSFIFVVSEHISPLLLSAQEARAVCIFSVSFFSWFPFLIHGITALLYVLQFTSR